MSFYCFNVQGGFKFPLIYYKKKYIYFITKHYRYCFRNSSSNNSFKCI